MLISEQEQWTRERWKWAGDNQEWTEERWRKERQQWIKGSKTIANQDTSSNTSKYWKALFKGVCCFRVCCWVLVYFPSSCNFRLQQSQPCEPIRKQNLNPPAIWLDGTVLALATGCCKNLEKRCTVVCKPFVSKQNLKIWDDQSELRWCHLWWF